MLTVLFAGALLASHLVGLLLGAIGFAVARDRPGTTGPLSTIEPSPPTEDGPGLRASYIYDFIHLRDAAAGGRLAKLRAEAHMCRVLIAGCIGLGVLHGLEKASAAGSLTFWTVLLSLAATTAAARFLPAPWTARAGRALRFFAPPTFPRQVLMAGCAVLGVAFGVANIRNPEAHRFWLVVVVLTATGWSSYLFHTYLRSRTQRLMANCWRILKAGEPPPAAGGAARGAVEQ
jgi:hypothetical protein